MIEVALRHAFPGFDLDVTFAAPSGVTALFGRSGTGKSSVALAVAGLFRPAKARINLGGRVLQDDRRFLPPHQRQIGMVFQDARLFPHLSVRQNLTYGQRRTSGGLALDLSDVAALLGLTDLLARGTSGLSGGEKARVALARALLAHPAALICDEPLAALDAPRRAEILPYLQALRDRFDLPILYISHSLAEVVQLAQSLVVLDAGRVAASGPVEQVLADPAFVSLFGQAEAGALIQGRITGPAGDGLTQIDTAGGPMFLAGSWPGAGAMVRLRVRAQDVMIALTPITGISALNQLAAVVESLTPDGEAGMIVALRLGPDRLLARLTRRSAQALGLTPGLPVQAIVKSVVMAGG